MTTSERENIRAAMDRILAGTPLRSDGAMTVVSLAAEADIKRHLLTHRHTDLRDEFYARVRAQGRTPASELALRDEITSLRGKLDEARDEIRELRESNDHYARVVNVLTVENEQLRRANSPTTRLVPVQSRRGVEPSRTDDRCADVDEQ